MKLNLLLIVVILGLSLNFTQQAAEWSYNLGASSPTQSEAATAITGDTGLISCTSNDAAASSSQISAAIKLATIAATNIRTLTIDLEDCDTITPGGDIADIADAGANLLTSVVYKLGTVTVAQFKQLVGTTTNVLNGLGTNDVAFTFDVSGVTGFDDLSADIVAQLAGVGNAAGKSLNLIFNAAGSVSANAAILTYAQLTALHTGLKQDRDALVVDVYASTCTQLTTKDGSASDADTFLESAKACVKGTFTVTPSTSVTECVATEIAITDDFDGQDYTYALADKADPAVLTFDETFTAGKFTFALNKFPAGTHTIELSVSADGVVIHTEDVTMTTTDCCPTAGEEQDMSNAGSCVCASTHYKDTSDNDTCKQCGTGEQQNEAGTGCECASTHYKDTSDNDTCKECAANSEQNEAGTGCDCSEDYAANATTGVCEISCGSSKKQVGEDACEECLENGEQDSADATKCVCSEGYEFNDDSTACVESAVDPNNDGDKDDDKDDDNKDDEKKNSSASIMALNCAVLALIAMLI